ncbi:type VI-A CRISPR-associated RNA-guided ribonuclease Cas13a [Candidatus Tokpelaia sp.]|uniref:type VI-A CRISPR-associated RNA-guided ribonuclease Cas13a n=1 Tax=Candidatus Tokpelaia sp. TaxID=2233777 RepID=UPI001239885D|nr:type VI-A CRISPR-associated RNA-guided ribonuclease Cas13a [Candidatus Tokpelaia sp.]KAA6404514.1 hypothetical protein DPQ22_09805 [Candidatus Tokpelaia sp.]
MKIIKPYGRSVVQKETRKREIAISKATLNNKAASNGQENVQTIAALLSQGEPILRQWLSIIDKIIAKPAADRAVNNNIADARKRERLERENKEKQKIRDVRAVLGQAVWEYLGVEQLFPQDITEAEKQKLKDYWDNKISAAAAKQGRREDFPKGRLYKLFVGSRQWQDIGPNEAETIVVEIYRHLYQRAYKIVPPHKAGADRARYGHKQHSNQDKRLKSEGLIADRAKAIAANVLQPRRVLANTDFFKQDIDRYRDKLRSHTGGDNLAARIRQAILAEQEKADKEPAYNIAVGELRAVWPVIFGEAKKYAEAQEADKALLAVHNAVKESYKQRLKGKPLFVDKQKPLVQGENAKDKLKELVCERLERLLPDNDDKLFALLRNRRKNRDINHLIRLGKIIHYTAADKARADEAGKADFAGDKPAFIAQYWPKAEEVENSRYWGSAGQTEIKQNEAFVRVWRRALAFAARTVKDWVDPNNNIAGDILFAKNEALSADRFNAVKAEQKYNLLFADDGDKSDKKPSLAQRDWCCFALKSLTDLRNAAFHFKGMGSFVEALQQEGKLREIKGNEREEEKAKKEAENNIIKAVCPVLAERYRQHRQKYQERLKDRLENIQLAYYLGGADIRFLWQKIAAGNSRLLPLPRLRRVLERAEKAWKGVKQGKDSSGKLLPEIALPDYVPAQNREGEAGEAANCQWAVLKLLYDGAFKAWLDALPYKEVQKYIDKAIGRATGAARHLNGKNAKGEPKSAEELLLTVSRNDGLYRLQPGDTIETFFYQLTAATATEMRVQNGHESNGAKAREQAGYIEDLKCDVVALALADYLQVEDEGQKKSLAFVLEIPQRKKTENPSIDVHKQLDNVPEKAAPQLWQAALYFLLHLMPVEEVSSLRQQIRKYQIIVQKPEGRGAVADENRPHLQHGSEQEIAAQLVQVLDLYIFMHDAQFMVAGKGEDGQLSELLKQDYADYYKEPKDFDTVFPKQEGQDSPQAFRDLREMQRFGSKVLAWLSAKDTDAYKVRRDSVKELFPGAEDEQEERERKRKELKKEIAKAQKKRADLHEEWVDAKNKKQWERENGQLYKELVQQIGDHQRLTAEVTLQNHVRLHRLLMNVLGRLVDFSGLVERDLYFTLLALLHEEYGDLAPEPQEEAEQETDKAKDRKTPLGKQFSPALKDKENKDVNGETIKKPNAHGVNLLTEGQIIEAFCKLTAENKKISDKIAELFSITGADTSYEERDGKKYKLCFRESNERLKRADYKVWIRNRFAHLALLEEKNLPVNLTAGVNKARQLMAYDRKLKNAVAKSVIELLDREGLELRWEMDKAHELHSAKVKAKQLEHLGGAKLVDKKGKDGKPLIGKNGRPEKEAIVERRHGDSYISMVEALFQG